MPSRIETQFETPNAAGRRAAEVAWRSFAIALTAFLTVVDLFATQAILPSLAKAYGVSAGAIGFAVNASTIGMARRSNDESNRNPFAIRRVLSHRTRTHGSGDDARLGYRRTRHGNGLCRLNESGC